MRHNNRSKTLVSIGLACSLFGLLPSAHAAPANVLCSTAQVVECGTTMPCETASALSADAPLFLRLKLNEKTVETIREGDRKQTSSIRDMVRSDGLVLLQGVEPARQGERSAIGWTMSIDETNGSMVITASGRDVGYTLFGACTAID